MNQWLRNIVAVLVAIMPVCALAQGAAPASSGATAENANNSIPAGSVAGPDQSWDKAQLQALWDTARHTAGTTSYEYKWIFSTDIRTARVARLSGLRNAKVLRAENLIDLQPELRGRLSDLYQPGQTSEPFAYTQRGAQGWSVLQLVSRSAAPPLRSGPAFEASARRWVKFGLLPPPEVLLADPLERARVAYWNATSAAAVAAIPSELTPNVQFGNHHTPLTLAIISKKRDLAQALIDHGANVKQCGLGGCPLSIAAAMDDATQALDWTQWLLGRGAAPDTIDTRYLLGRSTALSGAMTRGWQAVGEALLTAGASPDGAPNVRMTPVESAAAYKHRDLVEWLIAHGASVLPLPDRGTVTVGQHGNLYLAALSTGDTAFATWAESAMISAAEKSPRMRFAVFIEQGKRRVELADGANISLQAAPFKLVLVMRPEQADSVMVAASLNPAWLEEARRGDRRNPMFRLYTSAALTPTPKPESYELLVGQPCASDAKPTDVCPGVLWHLNRDSSERADFHEVRAQKYEYVREYRSIVDVSKDKPGPANPLQAFAGQTLYLVLASTLELGGPDSKQNLIGPRYVTLQLQK